MNTKTPGRKTTLFVLGLMILALILSACTGQPSQEQVNNAVSTVLAQTAVANAPTGAGVPDGMPDMPEGLTTAQQKGYGLIGKLPGTNLAAEGDYWMPTNDALSYCKANPEGVYTVPSTFTANGEDFDAKCVHILTGYANIGRVQDEAVAVVAKTATPQPIVESSPTANLLPSPTAMVADNGEQAARDAILAGCGLGQPSVVIGNVTIECDGPVLPAPANYSQAPAGYQVSDTAFDSSDCVTDGEMFAAHGFKTNGVKAVFTGQNIVWDSCKWNVQAVGIGTYWQPFLSNGEYTVTEANGTVSVNYGPGGKWVYGATIRQLNAMTDPAEYWVHDDVVLMAREFNFGYGRNPRYSTVPGVNLDLRGMWIQPDVKSTCPVNPVQAAALLGGDDPKFWTPPTWERGAWVFNSKGDGFHHFTWTGAPGFFDVWTVENGAVTVTAENAKLFDKKNFEEGSYHCVPE